MWFLQKWWPWPWSLSDFHQKNLPGSLELSTSAVKFSERSDQWCGLYIVQLRTDKQTNKQTDRQTDERALGECILCKIGLTDWVIYLLDWMWPRWRAQSIGPNDSNEKCAMSRVLFRINIAAIAENTWPWPFTFDHDFFFTFYLDIWPWDWSIITLMLQRKNWCFEENKPRNFQSLGQI